MAENKKFLDEEGLKVLWNQVNLNDYPNNEVLIGVINAIDNTKVDKIDGKDLSANDYTDEDKALVAMIPTETEQAEVIEFTAYTPDDIQTIWDSVVV